METNQAKTSKVIKCEFKKTWNGNNYDYNVELENGDSGIYSSYGKENNILNQEITYTIFENEWGKKIRPVTNSGKTGGFNRVPKNEKSISAQSAMKAAIELCCHNKIELDQLEYYAKSIFDWQNKTGNIQ